MRRFLIILSLIIILSSSSFSQGVVPQNPEDSVMQKLFASALYCQTLVEQTQNVIYRLINEEKIDSVATVLDYVDRRCGLSGEYYEVLDELLSIYDDTWAEKYGKEYFTEKIIASLNPERFNRWNRGRGCIIFETPPHYEYIYDNIINLAKILIVSQDKNSITYIYCLSLIEAPTEFHNYIRVNSELFPEIYEYYIGQSEKLRKDLYDSRITAELLLGMRRHLGASEIIGDKGEIGGKGGYMFKPFHFNVYLSLRGFNTKKNIYVEDEGTVYQSDQSMGGNIGVEFGVEYYLAKNISQVFLVGIGYDGFTIAEKDDDKAVNVSSMIGSITVANRYHFGECQKYFIGLNLGYNKVNYHSGPTDLSGNNFTVNLSFGVSIFSYYTKDLYEDYTR